MSPQGAEERPRPDGPLFVNPAKVALVRQNDDWPSRVLIFLAGDVAAIVRRLEGRR